MRYCESARYAYGDVYVIDDGLRLDGGLKLDLLVEEVIVVEIKAGEKSIPIFTAQLLTYLKLSGKQLGFLINFNVPLIKNGIPRLIHSASLKTLG